MDQLSPPFRFALLAVLAVGALWMVVLRPHGAPATGGATPSAAPASQPAPSTADAGGATAPGVKGLGRAVQHARDAAAGRPTGDPLPAAARPATPAAAKPAATPAAAAARPAAAAAKPVTAKPAKPAAAAPSRPTLLLFAGAGADDAAARAIVRSLRGPRVRTIIAPLSRLDLYSELIGNIPITTSPTLLIIGPNMQAQEIIGLPDRVEVQQALASARR